MPKIEGDGKSWLRRPKLYKGVVEPYKKKKIIFMYTRYSVITSAKTASACVSTFNASIAKFTVLLPQLRACSC